VAEDGSLSEDGSCGPLAGVGVVLLGSGTALDTFGTMIAEQGADVVRVEPPDGDPGRGRPPLAGGASLAWAVAARGTRSVTAALHHPDARALVRALVERAAVIGEALGTGGLEAAGLDPPGLRGPAVVVRFDTVPELVALAAGGMLSVTGPSDRPPVPLGVHLAGQLAGIFGAVGATAALLAARPGGAPVVVEAPSVGAVLRIAEWGIAHHERTGEVRQREGNRPSTVAPLDVYPSADGRHVAIVAGSDTNFSRLAAAMGRPELRDDPRFATSASRVARAAEINDLVAAWVAGRTAAEVESACLATGTPASRVRGPDELLDDPHLLARGDFVVVDDPVTGPHRQQAPHPRLVGRPAPAPRPAPRLGEQAEAVWCGELGVDAERLAALRAEGAL
jgi:formyl-CoA transferase